MTLRFPLALAASLALLAAPTAADARARGDRMMMRPSANPSALVAAEIAFARLAREKGQWTAFAETAAPGAEMFAPQRVLAAEWLKKRPNPANAVAWQAHAVWMSCDGRTGITHGAWQDGAQTGWFSTVWQRQKNGSFKWLLDQGDTVSSAIAAPEFLEGKVADCPAPGAPDAVGMPAQQSDALRPLAGPVPALADSATVDSKDGQSPDGTLAWRSTVQPDGTRDFTVWLWRDGAMEPVLNLHAAKAG